MIINFGSMGNDFLVPSGTHLPAPGETIVSTENFLVTPGGGKGMNQAVAAARAGAQVKMVGKIGNDPYGEAVMDTLRQEQVDTSLIAQGERKTGVAFIFVDKDGENCIINAAGANLEAEAAQIPDDMLNKSVIVMTQMEVKHEENWKLIERAHAKKARTILNVAPAAPVPPAIIQKLDYLIVNEIEALQIAASLNIEPEAGNYAKLAQDIVKSCQQLTCIITLGSQGAVTATKNKLFTTPVLSSLEIKDTTGAGDAFCGGFAAAIDAGFSLEDALYRASVTGSLACTAIGCQTAQPYSTEIDSYSQALKKQSGRSHTVQSEAPPSPSL